MHLFHEVFFFPIQLVPTVIHYGDQLHCYSIQYPCDTTQNPLCDTTVWLTSLSSRKASRQHSPRAKQWRCYYSYLKTRGSEANGCGRWLCHAQQSGTGNEGTVASCLSARGYCLLLQSQNEKVRVNTPICQSLQLISWHIYWK